MRYFYRIFLLTVCAVSLFSCRAPKPAENISLIALFSDNMVLQQNNEIHIWGKASKNDLVRVRIDKNSVETISDDSGHWHAVLPPMAAGGPYEIKVSGKDSVILSNVMIGEVWILAGQNVLIMPGRRQSDTVSEASKKMYPIIRMIKIEEATSLYPVNHIHSSGWYAGNPDSLGRFSSVGYYFASGLYEKLNVPVGIIAATSGFSRIESWTVSYTHLDVYKRQGVQWAVQHGMGGDEKQ